MGSEAFPLVILADQDEEFCEFARRELDERGYEVKASGKMWHVLDIVRKDALRQIVVLVDAKFPAHTSLLREIDDSESHRVISYVLQEDETKRRIKGSVMKAGADLVIDKNWVIQNVEEELMPYINRAQVRLAQLSRLADDHLTGLPSFYVFRKAALAALATARDREHPDNFSFIFLDGDKFGLFNKMYGEQVGDKVIQFVANLLKKHLRDADIYCRKSGDEFYVLIPGIGYFVALSIAEKLRTLISSTPIDLDGLNISVSVSFGVSEIGRKKIGPNEEDALNQLIRVGDANLRIARDKKSKPVLTA